VKALKLHELTAHEIRDMLRKREISAIEVIEDTYCRIDSVEDSINSFITLTREKAYEDAKKVEKTIKEGQEPPDLAGIPMAVKDNICTEGIRTTCASGMLADFVPPYSAEVYERLVNDSCITIGKTNMDEFAMGDLGNPCDGSAAAVASGEVCFSLGSDMGGSIRQFAALCGVVGMKPTYGLVSRYGLITSAPSLDQIGPITRDVHDCALVMNCIAGHDSKDSASVRIQAEDYRSALISDVKGFRIGIPKEYFGEGTDSGIKKLILEQIKVLEDLGAHGEEMSLPHSEYAMQAYHIIASAEASSNLARYDGVRYGFRAGQYDNLDDLYVKTRSRGFGAGVKRSIMLGAYILSSDRYDFYYKKALQIRTLIREDFNRAFEKYDVIITPVTPGVGLDSWKKIEDTISVYMTDVYTAPVNIAGIAAMSVPCGVKDGLPVSMQIIGRPFDEKRILQAAFACEQNSRIGGYQHEI